MLGEPSTSGPGPFLGPAHHILVPDGDVPVVERVLESDLGPEALEAHARHLESTDRADGADRVREVVARRRATPVA